MSSTEEHESLINKPLNKENREPIIIATIARMNPPTPGHLLLVSQMILEAAAANLTQITIILSHSIDSADNPLDCWTKRDVFLYASVDRLRKQLIKDNPGFAREINNVNIAIICMNDPFEEEVSDIPEKQTPVLKAINYTLQRFYMYPREDITFKLFVGDDRDYSKFLGKYLKEKDPPVIFNQLQLERTDMSYYKSLDRDQLKSLDIDSVPLAAMSASFVRNLVKYRLREQFNKVMKKAFLEPREIEELYGLLTDTLASSGGKRKRTMKKIYKTKKTRQHSKKTRQRSKKTRQRSKKTRHLKYRHVNKLLYGW